MSLEEASSMVRRELRAMNSDIELVCCRPDAERRLDRAEGWLAAFEERYSRFRVLSEVSRLNNASGRAFRASKGLYDIVALALEFARRSGGLFDPTVLRQLEDAGYDRSFDAVAARPGGKLAGGPARVSWQEVCLEPATRTITLPEGAGIDLGGMGKGFAVDRMAAILGSPCLVNGGGDIFVSGRPPGETTWRVGVADPFREDDDLIVLAAHDRGVATSSTMRRRWQAGGAVLHHLIDPRTGRPSTSDAVQVTVVAASTLLADVHAKVALLQGVEGGLSYLEREPDVEGLIVRSDGVGFASSGLGRYISRSETDVEPAR